MAPKVSDSSLSAGDKPGRKKSAQQRAAELVPSLGEDDDERTKISKVVSWILRHGAKKVNCKQDEQGWVLINNLIVVDILEGVTKDKLMSVIHESNKQKLRYTISEANGGMIKAVSKDERKIKREENGKTTTPPAVGVDGNGASHLRGDAPSFVPANSLAVPTAQPSASALNPMGYPFMPGYGYPSMMGMPMAHPQSLYPGMPYNPYLLTQQPGAAQTAIAQAQMMQAQQMMQVQHMAAAAMAAQAQALRPAAPAEAAPGRYRGRIRFFDADKGFGFVECPEASARFGRDVFLHKVDMKDLVVGSEVMFSVETNARGMPQARQVVATGAKGLPPMATAKSAATKGSQERRGVGGNKGRGRGGKGFDAAESKAGEQALAPGIVAPEAAPPAPAPEAPADAAPAPL